MRLFRAAYNSLVWALIITALCFSIEWLQMRVNTGYAFFGITIAATVALYLLTKKFSVLDSALFCLANLSICLVLAVFLLGPQRMPVVFAAFIREGLHQAQLPFLAVNIVLALLLIGGIAIILAKGRLKPETLKAGTFLAFIALALAASSAAWQAAQADGTDALSWLTATVNSNLPVALLLYTVVTVFGCAFLALPGAAFAILAGVAFGPVLGSAACLFATTLGAMLGFCLGRFFFKDAITPMLQRSPRLQKLLFASNRGDIVCLMVTRLVPLFPYNLQNYAYGATGISFWRYSLFSLLFMIPGVLAFCLAACGVFAEESRWLFIGVGALVLAAATGLGLLIKQRCFDSPQLLSDAPLPASSAPHTLHTLNYRQSHAQAKSAANPGSAIVIFSRIPTPGKTMTRMMPALTAADCVRLHQALFIDAVNAALATGAEVHVYHSPSSSAEPLAKLTDCLSADALPLVAFHTQRGDNLGERLRSATAEIAPLGYQRLLLIGIDTPQLDASALAEALTVLHEHDAVIYPAQDGGFCLLGVRQPDGQADGQRPGGAGSSGGAGSTGSSGGAESAGGAGSSGDSGNSGGAGSAGIAGGAGSSEIAGGVLQQLLSLDNYGTASVLADTLSLAQDLGVEAYLGQSCIDLDTVDDLRDFYRMARTEELDYAPNTRECLQSLIGTVPSIAEAPAAASPKTKTPQSLGWKLMRGSQLWEKNPYRFANYRRAQAESVLFPGCNFMAMYPRTLRHLERLLAAHSVGVLYECCYQPVAALGLADDMRDNHTALRLRLNELGVRELVTVCPTCHYFLGSRLGIPVVTIYEKLRQLGEGSALNLPDMPLFIPCPDRRKRLLIESMTPFLPPSAYDAFEDVPCCGLGGFMAWRKPQQTARVLQTLRDRVDECSRIADNSLRDSVAEKPGAAVAAASTSPGATVAAGRAAGAAAGTGRPAPAASAATAATASPSNGGWRFYTYCASCVSQFQGLGIRQAEHLLPLILGVNETPRRGALAVANRVLGKLR